MQYIVKQILSFIQNVNLLEDAYSCSIKCISGHNSLSQLFSPVNTTDRFTGLIMVIIRKRPELLGGERVRDQCTPVPYQWPI